ncbi:MAG: ABC transporter permease [Chlamydiales bacterium]
MISYILKKLTLLLCSLFIIVTATFYLIKSVPGNAFSDSQLLPKEVVQDLIAHYGFDQPLHKQYIRYLYRLCHLDFGASIKYENRSVSQIIFQGLPTSISLSISALLFALCIGIPIGSFVSMYSNPLNKTIFLIYTIIATSLPSFILAFLLQYLFAIYWKIFPVARFDTIVHMILPVLSLASFPAAFIAKLTHSSIVQTLQQPFITTAIAKGLHPKRIFLYHVLKNSLLPVIAYIGPLSASIFPASFVIERIFAIPGLGSWLITSISHRDYMVVLGITIFYSALLLFIIFFIDLLYPLLDPRICMREKRYV